MQASLLHFQSPIEPVDTPLLRTFAWIAVMQLSRALAFNYGCVLLHPLFCLLFAKMPAFVIAMFVLPALVYHRLGAAVADRQMRFELLMFAVAEGLLLGHTFYETYMETVSVRETSNWVDEGSTNNQLFIFSATSVHRAAGDRALLAVRLLNRRFPQIARLLPGHNAGRRTRHPPRVGHNDGQTVADVLLDGAAGRQHCLRHAPIHHRPLRQGRKSAGGFCFWKFPLSFSH